MEQESILKAEIAKGNDAKGTHIIDTMFETDNNILFLVKLAKSIGSFYLPHCLKMKCYNTLNRIVEIFELNEDDLNELLDVYVDIMNLKINEMIVADRKNTHTGEVYFSIIIEDYKKEVSTVKDNFIDFKQMFLF